jgi:hypothetical protein
MVQAMLKSKVDPSQVMQAAAELAANAACSYDEDTQRQFCRAINDSGDLQIRVSTRHRRVVVAIVNGDQEQILFDKTIEQETG